jgi:hypothetical protein
MAAAIANTRSAYHQLVDGVETALHTQIGDEGYTRSREVVVWGGGMQVNDVYPAHANAAELRAEAAGLCACKGGKQTARKARLNVLTLVNSRQEYQCVTQGTVT